MVAYNLTPLWGTDQFVPSAVLQAIGQSMALTGVFFYAILHLKPEERLTFGAAIQTARLMGDEIGSAFVVTLNRVREQRASNLIGLHVQVGDWNVMQRLQDLTRHRRQVGATRPRRRPGRSGSWRARCAARRPSRASATATSPSPS